MPLLQSLMLRPLHQEKSCSVAGALWRKYLRVKSIRASSRSIGAGAGNLLAERA